MDPGSEALGLGSIEMLENVWRPSGKLTKSQKLALDCSCVLYLCTVAFTLTLRVMLFCTALL